MYFIQSGKAIALRQIAHKRYFLGQTFIFDLKWA